MFWTREVVVAFVLDPPCMGIHTSSCKAQKLMLLPSFHHVPSFTCPPLTSTPLPPPNPHPPPPPLPPPQTRLLPLIPHTLDPPLNIPPPPLPPRPRLPHQTPHRLLLGPPLLDRHVWQICGAETFGAVGEGDADAVGAEAPVEGGGARGEVCEEGGAAVEGGEFGGGDGGEARVFEGAG